MTDSPADLFTQRRQQFLTAEQADQRRYDQWAIGRVIWFAGAAGIGWLLFRFGFELYGYLIVGIGAIGFGWLLKQHQTIRRSRDTNRHLAFINEDEAARLERRYLRSDTGTDFINQNHPYSADLDLFGPHSLFRLLNRTHTFDGRSRLAQWLCRAAPAGIIFHRQQAVAALKPQLDWRQQFEATALLNERVGVSPDALRQWAVTPALPLPGYLNWMRWLLPTVTLLTTLVWLADLVPGVAVLALLAIHALILSQIAQQVKQVSEHTHDIAGALSSFQALFRLIETMSRVDSPGRFGAPMDSPGRFGVPMDSPGRFGVPMDSPSQAVRLQDIRLALQHKAATGRGTTASKAVGRLAQLTENLNFRRNPYFYLFVGVALLWDVQYLLALQRWQRQYGPALGGWLDALAEIEALNSLAGLAFAHPDYATPDITDDALLLDAVVAAHPLLPPNRSVANSLTLSQPGQTVLITGSNMSGKSTFLRTLGLNLVLALAGSVVAARRFSCSPVQVFTSMRTQDSLEENTSSFYAELKRLQTLLQLTKPASQISPDGLAQDRPGGEPLPPGGLPQDRPGGEPLPQGGLPVLYFLDEILKGTNSTDRHRGAEALIRQLHQTTASGFVSTHDLALGQLSDAAGFVQNFHFQSDVINGRLVFDYTLRDGVCRSFNASELMRSIGIKMDWADAEPVAVDATKTA